MKRRRAVALFRPVTVNALAFIISRSLVLSSRSFSLSFSRGSLDRLLPFFPFFGPSQEFDSTCENKSSSD